MGTRCNWMHEENRLVDYGNEVGRENYECKWNGKEVFDLKSPQASELTP